MIGVIGRIVEIPLKQLSQGIEKAAVLNPFLLKIRGL